MGLHGACCSCMHLLSRLCQAWCSSSITLTQDSQRWYVRFLRFPGGCYVEGTLLSNAFYWKPSVGPIQQRPGHWNGMWQYWSTDGALLRLLSIAFCSKLPC